MSIIKAFQEIEREYASMTEAWKAQEARAIQAEDDRDTANRGMVVALEQARKMQHAAEAAEANAATWRAKFEAATKEAPAAAPPAAGKSEGFARKTSVPEHVCRPNTNTFPLHNQADGSWYACIDCGKKVFATSPAAVEQIRREQAAPAPAEDEREVLGRALYMQWHGDSDVWYSSPDLREKYAEGAAAVVQAKVREIDRAALIREYETTDDLGQPISAARPRTACTLCEAEGADPNPATVCDGHYEQARVDYAEARRDARPDGKCTTCGCSIAAGKSYCTICVRNAPPDVARGDDEPDLEEHLLAHMRHTSEVTEILQNRIVETDGRVAALKDRIDCLPDLIRRLEWLDKQHAKCDSNRAEEVAALARRLDEIERADPLEARISTLERTLGATDHPHSLADRVRDLERTSANTAQNVMETTYAVNVRLSALEARLTDIEAAGVSPSLTRWGENVLERLSALEVMRGRIHRAVDPTNPRLRDCVDVANALRDATAPDAPKGVPK